MIVALWSVAIFFATPKIVTDNALDRNTTKKYALQLAERLQHMPVKATHQQRQAVFISNHLANAWASLSSNSATAQAAVKNTIRMHEAIVCEER